MITEAQRRREHGRRIRTTDHRIEQSREVADRHQQAPSIRVGMIKADDHGRILHRLAHARGLRRASPVVNNAQLVGRAGERIAATVKDLAQDRARIELLIAVHATGLRVPVTLAHVHHFQPRVGRVHHHCLHRAVVGDEVVVRGADLGQGGGAGEAKTHRHPRSRARPAGTVLALVKANGRGNRPAASAGCHPVAVHNARAEVHGINRCESHNRQTKNQMFPGKVKRVDIIET